MDWVGFDEYRAAYNASSRDYEDSIATALYTLESAIAGDPLGQWITANALRSWTDDALTVLENLPCTGQELHEVARSEGMVRHVVEPVEPGSQGRGGDRRE